MVNKKSTGELNEDVKKSKTTSEISPKSTKQAIFDAYNKLLEDKTNQVSDPLQEKKQEAAIKLTKNAAELSTETVLKTLSELKIDIGKSVETLSEHLMRELKKFKELQEAVIVEEQHIKELYEIKLNANSLSVLILAQQEKRSEFELEMTAKQENWKKETERFEQDHQERVEQQTKEQKREEEDYKYTLELNRKKEKDVYEERKQTLEKSLQEREVKVSEMEKELEILRQQVGLFPEELSTEILSAEETIVAKLQQENQYKTDLFLKEIEGERKLAQQTIESLKNQVKELEEQLKNANQKASESVAQVQTIAVKAVEGASFNQPILGGYQVKEKEAKPGVKSNT